MQRKGGRPAFTDEQVRVIKANLVRGVTCATLARHYQCGEETIGRIRRGLTYAHVRVEGEEQLRPEIRVVGPDQKMVELVSGVTDEEIEQEGRELAARIARKSVAEVAREAVGEIDPEVQRQIDALRGVESALGEIPTDRVLD